MKWRYQIKKQERCYNIIHLYDCCSSAWSLMLYSFFLSEHIRWLVFLTSDSTNTETFCPLCQWMVLGGKDHKDKSGHSALWGSFSGNHSTTAFFPFKNNFWTFLAVQYNHTIFSPFMHFNNASNLHKNMYQILAKTMNFFILLYLVGLSLSPNHP